MFIIFLIFFSSFVFKFLFLIFIGYLKVNNLIVKISKGVFFWEMLKKDKFLLVLLNIFRKWFFLIILILFFKVVGDGLRLMFG